MARNIKVVRLAFAAVALTALCAAGAVVIAKTGTQPSAPAAPATFSDSGPEPQLSKILVEIENNRLGSALEQTEALLKQYPNFRLAHLIKGDLLLARSMPLSTFGNAINAPQEKLSDLREEVIARLKAYRNRAATTEYVGGQAQSTVERFRSYGSYEEAFRDYANLLRNNPRYGGVIGSQDGAEFAKGLQRAGYATDPAYADKLNRIINGPTLRMALVG